MTNEEKFESRKQNPKKIVYTATGLVIKYTNAITGASSATQGSSLVKPAVTQAVVEKAAAHPHASALLPQKHSVFSHK